MRMMKIAHHHPSPIPFAETVDHCTVGDPGGVAEGYKTVVCCSIGTPLWPIREGILLRVRTRALGFSIIISYLSPSKRPARCSRPLHQKKRDKPKSKRLQCFLPYITRGNPIHKRSVLLVVFDNNKLNKGTGGNNVAGGGDTEARIASRSPTFQEIFVSSTRVYCRLLNYLLLSIIVQER